MMSSLYYDDDTGAPTVVKVGQQTVHKARTKKECHYCPTAILPGQRYIRQAWIVDGDFQVSTEHAGSECQR